MNDNELERLLRRYRPAGPEPSLRARILNPPRRQSPVLWMTAAAVLLVAIALHALASRTYREIARTVEDEPAMDGFVVDLITADLTHAGIAPEAARQLVTDWQRQEANRQVSLRTQTEEIPWAP